MPIKDILPKRSPKEPLTRREIARLRREQEQRASMPSQQAYRRNHNLNTPKTSTPAEHSERLQAHQLQKKRRLLVSYLVGALGVIIMIIILFWNLVAHVTVSTSESLTTSEQARYIQILDDYYAAHPAERLRFFAHDETLRAAFLAKAPEIKTVEIVMERPLHATLRVAFRQPVAQWLTDKNGTYFVDENGVIFQHNHTDAQPSVTVRDESGAAMEGGKEVVNHRTLEFLGRAVSLLQAQGYAVEQVVLPVDTIRQVSFQLADQPLVKMTIDRTAQAQVAQAKKALDYLHAQQRQPKYIDVRVDQRVFYAY